MKYLRRILTIAFAFSLNFTVLIAKANDQSDDDLGLANALGKVTIVRHAIAPGTGDPGKF